MKTCGFCKKEYTSKLWFSRYCSLSCSASAQAAAAKELAISKYHEKPNICRCCGSAILYKPGTKLSETKLKIFCNKSCNAVYQNSKRLKTRALCAVCEKPVSGTHNIYCSVACQQELKIKEKIDGILKIKEFPYGSILRQSTKYTVLILDTINSGHKCGICGLSEWRGKEAPLIIDHIDGNHENNKFENLRWVCANCDMQLPTYKNKNRGNGRHSRKVRYQEGKSY